MTVFRCFAGSDSDSGSTSDSGVDDSDDNRKKKKTGESASRVVCAGQNARAVFSF